jgi:8-oxo-dGTP pyrophosphatase MutT (NUDIX family)
MRREVLEEAHLDVGPYAISLITDDAVGEAVKMSPTGASIIVRMRFFTYQIDIHQPADAIPVRPSQELPTLLWSSLDRVGELKLPPPSLELFKNMGILV